MNYIYSYWSNKNVSEDLFNPILISIATLREKTEDEIFVFDYGESNWENYDKKLNFKVIKTKSFDINKFTKFQQNVFYRNIHLLEFIKKSKKDEFSLIDSDIFWLSPISFDNDKFNIRCGDKLGFNNGCYFFNKNKKGMQFMEKFVFNLQNAILDMNFRNSIINKYFFLNDETVCRFTYENAPELCTENNFHYNGALFDVDKKKWIQESKNIHIVHGNLRDKVKNKFFVKKCGLIGFLLEETKNCIKTQIPNFYKKFSKEDIKSIKFEDVISKGTNDLIVNFKKLCIMNHKFLN
jgi:hypothetical protein